MLTRSQRQFAENREADIEAEGNRLGRMEKHENKIPKFKGTGAVSVNNFLKIFERKTEDRKEERTEIITDYLEEEALNYALSQDLYKLTWEEAKTKLSDYFSSRRKTTMQELLQIRLSETDGIEEYYRRMTDAALDLGIQDQMLLEMLISGLTPELKTLNLARNFDSISQWMEVNRVLFHHLEKEGSDRRMDRKTTPRAVESGRNRQESGIERTPVRRPIPWQPHPQAPRWQGYSPRTAQHTRYQPPRYTRGWGQPSYDQGSWRPYADPPTNRQPYPGAN